MSISIAEEMLEIAKTNKSANTRHAINSIIDAIKQEARSGGFMYRYKIQPAVYEQEIIDKMQSYGFTVTHIGDTISIGWVRCASTNQSKKTDQ